MQLQVNVFDVWAFRRTAGSVEYLLLHTSQRKADRWFNGGRFWQVPSAQFGAAERVPDAIGEVAGGEIRLDPDEHAEYRWCPYEEAQRLVAYRGLKDGLVSVRDYVTERAPPLPELRLV